MKEANDVQLGEGSIGKWLLRLTIPAVIAQLINVLYNIVDRIFIGKIPEIGATALTGVGVTFPLVMIIAAFSAFIGMGAAPLVSIKLGEKDQVGAEKILGNSVISLLLLSATLTTIFQIFKEPLLLAFGASAQTLPYAESYFTIYLWGTLFVQLSLGLNTFISAQGHANIAMFSVLIGAVLNTILDPIFIFGFHLGVQGAALATVLSQAASAFWVMHFLLSPKSDIKIRREHFRLERSLLRRVAFLGLAPFIMQSTESFVQIVLNRNLQLYGGDLYVGAMTIIISVMQLFVMPVNGFAQGAQPLLSFNYGAKKIDRVRKAFRLVLFGTLGIATAGCFLLVRFPTFFARFFTDDPALLRLTAYAMPIFMCGIFIFGAQIACQVTFLSMGQAKISIFLALLRKVILLIPLAIILPRFFGVDSIFYAEPIADITAGLTTISLFAYQFRRILARRCAEA